MMDTEGLQQGFGSGEYMAKAFDLAILTARCYSQSAPLFSLSDRTIADPGRGGSRTSRAPALGGEMAGRG
jgi:hypothetical protein